MSTNQQDPQSAGLSEDQMVPVHLRRPPAQRKELPFDFWRRIGSPKHVVAPMVDNSDLAFRMQTRKYNAHLTFTQMLNANSFVNSKEARAHLFQTCPEDRPLVAQLAGCDPAMILKAAQLVEGRCDAVDMNFGCPQGIAKRGRYGAFLMEELELLDDIVRTLVEGLSIPVTCKTRIYHDFERTITLCETLYNAGAYALTIHGRTREEKGQFVANPDWDTLKRIKDHFRQKDIPIPIIANGGIETMDDVRRCLEYTGCDGVMTSEGILENPALFSGNLTANGIYMNQLDLAGMDGRMTIDDDCLQFICVTCF
jgi:tRNA-dihydrouridine synthase 1